mmetsp:Transcript_20437/g.66360  ORF Transcript_20437/g.66360 Transcript_20437/m.66360 type:complete len:289 (-) Transcript_20437:78-944(-)
MQRERRRRWLCRFVFARAAGVAGEHARGVPLLQQKRLRALHGVIINPALLRGVPHKVILARAVDVFDLEDEQVLSRGCPRVAARERKRLHRLHENRSPHVDNSISAVAAPHARNVILRQESAIRAEGGPKSIVLLRRLCQHLEPARSRNWRVIRVRESDRFLHCVPTLESPPMFEPLSAADVVVKGFDGGGRTAESLPHQMLALGVVPTNYVEVVVKVNRERFEIARAELKPFDVERRLRRKLARVLDRHCTRIPPGPFEPKISPRSITLRNDELHLRFLKVQCRAHA